MNSNPIKVMVAGAAGNMGAEVTEAVAAASGMKLYAAADPAMLRPSAEGAPVSTKGGDCHGYNSVEEALRNIRPDVMADFTHPDAVAGNVKVALKAGVHCVVGTTGHDETWWGDYYYEVVEDIDPAKIGDDGLPPNLFVAPNFARQTIATIMAAVGFVKVTRCGVEIIERHRLKKADAPSGTAVMAAQKLAPYVPEEFKNISPDKDGRGYLVDGIPVHAVRGNGYTAVLEIACMHEGGTTTFCDEVKDRKAFMPGVIMATRNIPDLPGFTYGLDQILGPI